MGCLCGCGGDNLHCLRPNRPPSPNTFYENFWAPNFAHMLKSRLQGARMKLEPSKRIWWREEFGGCAPDREPLVSEIWGPGGNDRGNVLRTSPPPFSDDTCAWRSRNEDRSQSPRKRQRSTSPLNTSIRSPDEGAITSLKGSTSGLHRGSNDALPYLSGEALTTEVATCGTNPTLSRQSFTRTPKPPSKATSLQSPTHSIPKDSPPLQIPDSSLRHQPHTKTESLPEGEHKMFRRPLEAVKMRENRRLGTNKDQCVNETDGCPASTADDFFAREAGEQSARRVTNDWTHADNSSRSLFRAPAVRTRLKSPKSPTHYIPDRLPPLRMPDFSKIRSVRHKRKEFTAEEDEQLLQSTLRKFEAMKLARRRRYGIPLNRGEVLSAGKLQSSSQGNQVEEVPSNIQAKGMAHTTEDIISMKQSLYERIAAMKLRRNRRHGTAIYQHEDAVTEGSTSTPYGDQAEEAPSDIQAENLTHTAEDTIQVKQSLYEKIEAMKLRRSRRYGTAIYQHQDAAIEGSPSTSHDDHIEEVLSNSLVMQEESSTEEHQQWRQSLYQKIEALKLRKSRCHGTAIHQCEDAVTKSSTSTSYGSHVEELPSDTRVMESETPADEHQRWRQSLYQKIESMKLRRNRRQGTAIHQHEDAAVKSSPSTSQIDHLVEVASTTLPTSIV